MYKKFIFLFFIYCISVTKVSAISTVYFIWSFGRSVWKEIPFSINGYQAFSLIGKPLKKIADFQYYSKSIRKVMFTKEGKYIVSADQTWYEKPYHTEVVLNLEDDDVYYIELQCNISNSFNLKILSNKEGEKKIMKMMNDDKVSVNPEIVYGK